MKAGELKKILEYVNDDAKVYLSNDDGMDWDPHEIVVHFDIPKDGEVGGAYAVKING